MRRVVLATLLLATALTPACRRAPLPPPAPFAGSVASSSDTFLVLGDSRRGFPVVEWGEELSDDGHLAFAEALRDERPAFVVHVGDIARTGDDEGAWHDFDVDFGPLRDAGIAMFPVLGNHEYRGDDARALDLYFARFPDLGRRRMYARTFRGVRLLFLDSNVADLGAERTARELAWLERRLTEAHDDDSVRAVMLFLHHPAWSNRVRAAESPWVRDDVLPLASRFPKVRALFAGHVHAYEHFQVGTVHAIVTGGGGSPLHDLSDADDPGARPDLYRGPRGFHYCRVRVGEQIVVEVVMRGGDDRYHVVDRFDI